MSRSRSRRIRLLAVIAAMLVAGAAGCSKASEETAGKRIPALPPPPEVEIPAALSIPLSVDGAAVAPITKDRLQKLTPDYADAERRAWKLTKLVPELDRPGAAVEARGPNGIMVRLDRPAAPDAMEPVLFLTRRGDVVVSMVDPANPFPGYHGQGGRLRRQGDPLPRLSPVTSLAVVR